MRFLESGEEELSPDWNKKKNVLWSHSRLNKFCSKDTKAVFENVEKEVYSPNDKTYFGFGID